MESLESPPYEEIERLCRLMEVPFNLYNLKASLQAVIVEVEDMLETVRILDQQL